MSDNGLSGLNNINGVDGLDILKNHQRERELADIRNQVQVDALPKFSPHQNLGAQIQVIPKNPPAPVYRNNPIMEGFQQRDDGFGFSNFRVEETLPDSINRSNRDFQYEHIRQWTNPLAEQSYNRHSNFLFREHYGDFKTIDEEKVPDDYIYLDIIKNFHERNPLLDLFFSRKNLNHLQELIKQMVYHQSERKYNIGRQRDNELLTIMRSIYISTPTNPYVAQENFRQEICKLNKNVLDYAVPKVLVGIQQYLGYVRDQGNTVYPPERPSHMSSAGTRINRGFDFNFV